MPRGIRNWTYKDVIAFLKERGFSYHKPLDGSHEHWISEDKKSLVNVNFITGSQSYPPLTMKTMIRQSGIQQDNWVKWAGS